MKNKLMAGIFVLALLLCQGIAFAESTEAVDTAKATAEDAVAGSGDSLDMMTQEETAAPADELYTPAAEPVKTEAAVAAPEENKPEGNKPEENKM